MLQWVWLLMCIPDLGQTAMVPACVAVAVAQTDGCAHPMRVTEHCEAGVLDNEIVAEPRSW